MQTPNMSYVEYVLIRYAALPAFGVYPLYPLCRLYPSRGSPRPGGLKNSRSRLGLALVGTADHLEGIITDGDLRRALIEQDNLLNTSAADVMSTHPLTIKPSASMGEAEDRMQEARIQCLVVTNDDGLVVGVVQIF